MDQQRKRAGRQLNMNTLPKQHAKVQKKRKKRPPEMEATKSIARKKPRPSQIKQQPLEGKKRPPKLQKQARVASAPKRKYRARDAWWAVPVSMSMAAVLIVLMGFAGQQARAYAGFVEKKKAVGRQTFYPGVALQGEDLSGYTYDQALQLFNKREADERAKFNIELAYGDKRWQLSAGALGFRSDIEAQLQAAWTVGRYGTLDERFSVISSMRELDWRRDMPVQSGLDQVASMEKLQPFAASMSVPSEDAQVLSFDEKEKSFQFSDGKVGYQVDPMELYQDILRAAESGEKTVNINRHQINPKDTAQTLSATYGLIASAVTNASSSSSNRLTNLKISCKALNGMRIEPGEVFSFNKALGKRTANAGYKPAPAYENGMTTNQYGGGICQTSTTLFNAVAKADMRITERSPHSRPSSYVDIGKDAAVNWPNQDFKFINNTDYPIYLVAWVSSNKRVNVQVYGKKLLGDIKIKITSEITQTLPTRKDQVTIDPNLLPGERVVVEPARRGYTAMIYKHYFDADGNVVRKETLGKSTYAPSGAIVRVGA